MKHKVLTNVYHIPQRLKEIDSGYFIMYDDVTKKFEVHNKKQPHSTLSLNVPYDELDERTVNLVLKTRVENAQKFIKEMEEENLRIEQEKNKKKMTEVTDKVTEMAKYVEHKSDIDFVQI